MGIQDISSENFVAPYTRPHFGTAEAEEAWKQRQAKRREKQKVIAEVAEGCSVSTVGGAMKRDGEELAPGDVGGMANLERLARVGAVNMISENQLKSNAGEYEYTATRSFTHGGRIYDVGEGFSAEELDVPATEPERVVTLDGKIVEHPGRPAIPGAETVESLIKRQLAKRAELRKRVTRAVKARLAKGKASEASE